VEINLRVALISDIHANLPALHAVLQDVPDVDCYICAGDIVGYYPFANEVCDLVRNTGAYVVRGNHDAFAVDELKPREEVREVYRVDWTRKQLDSRHLKWLASLPIEMSFYWAERVIRVRHASPWDEETYLYPDSKKLTEIKLSENEIHVFGHTHHPMKVTCGKGFVVNPGSVGQPRDWNPKAGYAILDTISGDVEFRRVNYDYKKLQAHLIQLGWEAASISILSRERF
jgi:putative phosphoesterase